MYISRIEHYTPFRQLARFVDISFLLRFLVLMSLIYYFNFGYMSLVDERGLLYSADLDQHLNYFGWLRSAILHMSNLLVHLFGFESYIPDIYTLRANGRGVHVGLECLGYGMMSFWLAFILAHDTSWKTKLFWSVTGIVMLWMLNCIRVALLLVAVIKHFNFDKHIDNHSAFNIAVYLLTIVMIAAYYHVTKRDNTVLKQYNA